MRTKLLKVAAFAASASCALGAFAGVDGQDWTGGGDDTNFSTQANWQNSRATDSTAAIRFEDQGGKTVTFDGNYNTADYIWIGVVGDGYYTEGAPNPVIWEASAAGYGLAQTANNLRVADSADQTGALKIASGTYSFSTGITLGTGTGYLEIGQDAVVAAGNGTSYWASGSGASATAKISGTLNFNGAANNAALYLGDGAGAAVDIDIDGGTVNANDGDVVMAAGNSDSSADIAIDISNGGTFACGVNIHRWFKMNSGGAGTTTVNVNEGGTLAVWHIQMDSANGSGYLNINGGTLKALGAYDEGGLVGAGETLATTIGEKGATVDTQNFNVYIKNVVAGAGGLVKTGTGTLTFTAAPTFNGTITVLPACGSVTVPEGTTVEPGANTKTVTNEDGTITFSFNDVGDDIWTGAGETTDWADADNWSNAMLGGRNWVINSEASVSFADANSILTGLWIEGSPVEFSAESSSAGLVVGNAITVGTQYGQGSLAIDGGSYVSTSAMEIGNTGIGAVEVKGGSLKTVGDFLVSHNANGVGTFTVSGGTAASDFWFCTGRDSGGNATVDITGGELRIGQGTNSNGKFDLGCSSGATTTFTQSGGYVYAPGSKNTDTLGIAMSIAQASGAIANVTLSGDAEMDLDGSVVVGTWGAGTLVLNGGTLATTSVSAGTGENSSATFTINGGTLKAKEAGTLVSMPIAIGENGATIDTEYAVSVTGAISGSGTLTKAGTGVLTLAEADLTGFEGVIAVAENGGKVVVPATASIDAGEDTLFVRTDDGFEYYYSPGVENNYVWTGGASDGGYWSNKGNWRYQGAVPESAPAADDCYVTIPYGSTVLFDYSEDVTVGSLRVDGHLEFYGNGRLLTAATSGNDTLKIYGVGTVSFATVSGYSGVMVQPESTVAIEVRVNLESLSDGATVFNVGAGSTVTAAQVKIPGSTRAIERKQNADYSYSFTVGELAGGWYNKVTSLGKIFWDEPVSIAGDSDVATDGELLYAYTIHSTSYTVNTVPFTRYQTSGNATVFSFTPALGHGTERHISADVVEGLAVSTELSQTYKDMLAGYYLPNGAGKTGVLNLTGLTKNNGYLIQIWVQASNLSGSNTFYMSVDGDSETQIELKSSASGIGQYVTGYFIAGSETLSLTFTPASGSTVAISAFQLRNLTEDVVWNGGATGTWNKTGLGWDEFTAEYNIWKTITGFAFNATVDSAALTVSGDVSAGNVTLSGGASVTVPEGASMDIGSNFAVSGDSQLSGEGEISIGGAITQSGYGTLTLNATASNFSIARGAVEQLKANQTATIDFGSTALKDDEYARSNGAHASYFGAADVTITSLTGQGNISSDGKVILNLADDSSYAGQISGTHFEKFGEGALLFLGSVSGAEDISISGGTLKMAKPSDLASAVYDFDASVSDTIVVEDGVVTSWKDSINPENGCTLTPLAEDTHLSSNNSYVMPTLVADDDSVFGGKPAVASSSLRMDSDGAVVPESTIVVMQFTGDSVPGTRIIMDRSDQQTRTEYRQNYRWHVVSESSVPYLYNYNKDADSKNWISLNGVFDSTFSAKTPTVMTVPWHWARGNKGDTRRIAYGSGAAMAFAEILNFSEKLTIEEIKAIEAYLMGKWGISEGGYKPFGDGKVTIAAGAGLDASDAYATIDSLDCSGTLKGLANLTVSGDVAFGTGAKVYVNSLTDPVMKVGGRLTGGSNVTVYVKNAETGEYEENTKYSVRLQNGQLVLGKSGFYLILR